MRSRARELWSGSSSSLTDIACCQVWCAAVGWCIGLVVCLLPLCPTNCSVA